MYFLGMFFMFFAVGAFAQQTTVTGMVTDPSGEPVIGATIQEKGTTNNGTITDYDGNFSLRVQPNATLMISYIGYKNREVKAQAGSMRIVLEEDNQLLDEVVVVGFGTQKKVNLTGSVGIATAKDIQSRPVTNAVQALQGVVPGLKITTSTGELDKTMDIAVRGTGTIGDGSSGKPLILIDGMEGDLNTINPQDIENISVLKDAASSSIYGSRAPFGVILVTTKSGQTGRVSVNYNNSFRVASPINLPESMDSYGFANFMNTAIINNGGSAKFSDETMQKMLDFQAGKLTGGLDPNPNNPNVWSDPWSLGYANTDLYAETYKSQVFSQEHNLSVSGGSERMTYYASANFLDQGGMLKIGDDGLNRFNVSGKITATLTDWLKFSYSTRFTRNDVWRPRAFSGSYYNYYGRQNWPNIPMYDPNGHIYGANALAVAKGGQREMVTDRTYHQGSFTIEPIKNWITKIEFNYSTMNSNTKEVTLPAYEHRPDGTENNTNGTSYLYQDDTKEDYWNLNIYSEYSHSFNDVHNFKIMGGFQAEDMHQRFYSVRRAGIMFNDFPEFNLTSGLQGNGSAYDSQIYGYQNEWAIAGFFGRLNYDYMGKYLFEANLRYDGSSRFRRGSRWQWAPSFSLGWNMAQEGFWEPLVDTVNQLKLRFSYGQLSNQNTNTWYPTYRTMTMQSGTGDWLLGDVRSSKAYVGDMISQTMTWESVGQWNAGVDFGLFNNRLSGQFDYFIRYTKDMIGPAPSLPSVLGITPPKTNNCDLHTQGWELSLTWRDRLNNGLGYGITASLSDQDTYIDSYPGNRTNAIRRTLGNGDVGGHYIEGQKVGLIWGYETVGIAKTQEEMDAHLASLPNGGQNALGSKFAAGDIMYADLNNDGKIDGGAGTWDDHGDLKILGDANPHYFFGLDLTADYKGFDLRAFFQGVLKHDYWPGGNANDGNEGPGGYFWGVRGNKSEWHIRGFVQHEDYFRAEESGLNGRIIPANTDAYFPRPIVSSGAKNQQVQTRYMQNARYVRLKNLQLGYTLPNSLTNKWGISNLRLFVSGENVFTLTPLFDVFDPETCAGGVGGNAYPLSRTWSAGLSLTF
ncbi:MULTISPECIES: TonB-dependent receptor [unclassified Parabacteroides]|uniref:SusC/RagA family TonB-linked outer membrane protein n=1 Tax=unclassified Parabacteroides TaxID=2649774 RepID=UPI00247450B3|nr:MULTISPECIES: TonB-dependent receptor [unclassified Parabacteroides]